VKSFARITLYLLVLLTLVPVHSYADIAQGYSWLATQQQADGRVDSTPSLVHPLQATVEAVLAFDADSSATGLNRSQALAFISTNTELSTEFVVRARLLGIDVDGEGNNLLARLITHQDSGGGFGSFPEFNSNTLDTVLALSALASVKNEYPSEISRAVGYLLNQQQNSGVYSLYLSGTPSLPLTAFVTIALQNYVFDFASVAQTIAGTSQYILDNQAAGTGLENNWQIALSLLAIVPSIRDSARYAALVESLSDDQLANGSWGNDVYATALAIQSLQLAANITFPEEPTTGLFSGRILDNDTGNPIANAAITLTENTDISTTTDEQGRFSLDGVEPGAYTLNYQIAGYSGATQFANVAIGQVTNVGDIRLQRLPNTATVSGTITDAMSGQALSGAVIVFTSGGTNVSASLNTNGIYTVALAPDTYSFVVSLTGYQPLTGSATVEAGNNITFSPALYPENEAPVETAVTVLGVVIDESTNAPIAGATVQVSGVTANTGSDGSFRIEDLDEGNLTLTVSAQDYVSRQLQLVAPAGSVGDVGSIALMPNEASVTSSVFGTITNSETGEPILGATVLLEDTGATTTSLSTGAYTLADIELLTFNLFVSAPGYWSQSASFSLSEVGSSRFDVALTPSDLGGFAIEQLTTDQANYGAYAPVAISANLVNPSEQATSTQLFLEVFNESNEAVASLPIGDLAGGTVPGEPIIVLPNESASVEAQWYTGIFPPGRYSLKLSAYDQFTSQLLSEQVDYFDIAPTAVISEANLTINSRFSNEGVEENLILNLDVVNRSNIPIDFTVDYQWLDPQGNALRTGNATLSLTPDQAQQLFSLDEYRFTFESSGVYPFEAQITSDQVDAIVNGVTVTVAPSVRIEATQNLTPSSVVPDGDKRITIDITVEGIEQ